METFKGSPFEIGKAYGQTFADRIRECVSILIDRIGYEDNPLPIGDSAFQAWAREQEALVRKLWPSLLDEMRGVAEGVQRVPGAVAIVKQVEQASKADLEGADGLVLGSPTYFADIAGKMKVVLDDWNWKLGVDFTDKVGGAFSTGGGPAGGKEHTVISLLLYMINNRMVVAGPLYEGRTPNKGWAELGAAAATGPTDPGISDSELDAARRVGERVARLAQKMKREPH